MEPSPVCHIGRFCLSMAKGGKAKEAPPLLHEASERHLILSEQPGKVLSEFFHVATCTMPGCCLWTKSLLHGWTTLCLSSPLLMDISWGGCCSRCRTLPLLSALPSLSMPWHHLTLWSSELTGTTRRETWKPKRNELLHYFSLSKYHINILKM